MENSSRDGNTRPPDLPPEKSAGQEATVITGHGTIDWFQIGKEVRQGCILSPCLFNLYTEYIMRNAGLEEVNFHSSPKQSSNYHTIALISPASKVTLKIL